MPFLALKNLSSPGVEPCDPWNFTPTQAIPQKCIKDKKERDRWINDPTTSWCVYTAWEGLTGTQRISKPTSASEGNPPHRLHGFAVDFDAKMDLEEVQNGIKRFPFKPQFYERSLSGKCHLIWIFESPLTISGWDLAVSFLRIAADRMRFKHALPSFDDAQFTRPNVPLTHCGNAWEWISDEQIPQENLTAWLLEAGRSLDWSHAGYKIPLDVVRAELQKNPLFANSEWGTLDFKVDAQGPTWWIPSSQSPKSAIVKEQGFFTFSSSADRTFYTWADLLGHQWVQQFKDRHIGETVKGVYFDGREYWREISRGAWKPWTRDDLSLYLTTIRGVQAAKQKGETASELALALCHIQDHQNVEGAAPFVFRPSGMIEVDGSPFLNIHTARVMAPAAEPTVWGPTGGFPFLSKFFGDPSSVNPSAEATRFFRGGPLALDTFISWLAKFYRGGYNLNLTKGANIFISGPVNRGKTFLNRAVIGAIMNGFREAEAYLMGEDSFGSELFRVAHWVVDDNAVGTSAARRRRWTEAIKKMAANSTFVYHEKFRTKQQVRWPGNVCATLNADEGSTQLIPDLERSILDKIHLYAVDADHGPTVQFPEQDTIDKILKVELPHFCRYLLDWQTPEHCIERREDGSIDHRFGGIKPWHDPQLVQHANQSSSTSGFYEVLAAWSFEYFKIENENRKPSERVTSWTGTAFELRKRMCSNDPATLDSLRGIDINTIGSLLMQLRVKGHKIDVEDKNGLRYWTIHDTTVG